MDPLIVGLDPGSTIGYAILNLDGELISVDSIKSSLNDVISKVSKFGKIIIVGADVDPVPKMVEKFSSLTGAKIVFPNGNMLFIKKRDMTRGYLKNKDIKLKNRHELDALAAALIAWKSFKTLFNKIENEIHDEKISKEVKKLVIIENMPIKKALNKIC
mgnify:CR=1 FL=1